MAITPPMTASLDSLEQQVARDLDLLDHPKTPWVRPRQHPSGAPVVDVLIVGAGQSGLALSFALRRDNVTNVIAVDRKPKGAEGPWNTYARMRQLRTALDLTGPDLGIPSLTPRAWFTATHGAAAWDALERFPTDDWHEYLSWYRRVLKIPVWNETEIGPLEAENPNVPDSLIRVPLTPTGASGRDGLVYAREVVLANGLEGCGEWHVPELITDALPPERYAQANGDIDFAALQDRRVAILGANAGAFDNAATALEAGAAEACLFVRRREIAKVNAHKPFDTVAFLKHFTEFNELERWRIACHVLRTHQPPPQETFDRAIALDGFHMHEDAPWKSVALTGDEISVETVGGERFTFDFVIAATGHINDFSLRTETSGLADKIALWRDRFTPPPGEEYPPGETYPYLGDNFEFTEKTQGEAPYLHHIHCFSLGTLFSLGMTGSSVTTMRFGIPRILEGLTRQLFHDDIDHHYRQIMEHDEIDLVVPGDVADP
ncbi:MAG: NAD(P)/FAD-dependent oxidoreductase [Alphaproteobacteria bacterium]|nr:NAD(P)/FAD-dependent oxidoreductase [Alphaproteobacteria bacterium]